MWRTKLAVLLCILSVPVDGAGATADNNFELGRAGKYNEAMEAGVSDKTPTGATLAARAAVSILTLSASPCLACAQRAQALSRQAISINSGTPFPHIYLAVALGYEARIVGALQAAREGLGSESKKELETAIKADPRNALALATLGAWHIDTARIAGPLLARLTYGANVEEGIEKFTQAMTLAPNDPVIAYQYALELASYDPETYRSKIESTLKRVAGDLPASQYERETCRRSGELLLLLKTTDVAHFQEKVLRYMGIPG